MKRTQRSLGARAVVVLAAAYPVALVAVSFLFRFVGERWWLTGFALYVPRVVLAIPLPLLAAALGLARAWRWLWTQLLAGLLLVFILMGYRAPLTRTAPTLAGPTFRLLSYNVSSQADAVLDEVVRFAPDVALFQEIGPPERLTALLKERFAHVQVWNQFAIASRFPIVSTEEPPPVVVDGKAHSPRYFRAVIETTLGRIVFYNVHPVSPRLALWRVVWAGKRGLLRGESFSEQNAKALEENSAHRAEQVATFAAAAARETAPVIIAGDTNLPDLSWALGHSLGSFQDAFREVGSGFGYTFPTNRFMPWMRIDRIFANEALRFARFETGSSKGSDHLCVVADIGRRPE